MNDENQKIVYTFALLFVNKNENILTTRFIVDRQSRLYH